MQEDTAKYLVYSTYAIQYISKITFKHINNNHKALTFNQIRELKERFRFTN